MNIIFLEPAFPANQREFVRALAAIGATVYGIGERPPEWLDDETRARLAGYWQIASVTDEPHLEWAVREAQKVAWIDRLETPIEAHVLPAARVRERCSIPGISSRTAWLCRDKVAMKEALREAGVPTAASAGVSRPAEAADFARAHGFPVILKPRDAAGAAGTFRADDPDTLAQAIHASGLADGAPCAIEEFVEGHEGFYDTLTVQGRVACDFISHYYPERARGDAQPLDRAADRRDEPHGHARPIAEVREMGRRVSDALGMGTSATHMEWFFGPKGPEVLRDRRAVPPGVGQWDSYCAGNEFDLYREWALAVCHHTTDRAPSRAYACGIIALRPDRDGRISHYEGTEHIFARYGDLVVGQHFPEPGTPTQPVEAGYMANAWMRMRHPDYDALRGILDEVGRTIRVRAA
jgi:hypothetical protein